MALATDHVRYLRGLAHSLSPIVLIGNKGISDNLLDELKQALDRHELVKLRVLADTREERDQLVAAVQKHTGAELVQRVGHTATLYRQHPTRPKIALPGARPKGLGPGAPSRERSAGPRRDDDAATPARAGHDGNMPFRRDADERPPSARPAPGRFTRDTGPRPARPARADTAERGRFSSASAGPTARPGARPGARPSARPGAAARPFKRDAGGRFERDASAKPFRRDSGERSPSARPARPGAAPRFERDAAPRPYRRDASEGGAPTRPVRARPGAPQRFDRGAGAKPFRRDSGERSPSARPSRPGAAPRFERDAAPRPFRRDPSESSARAPGGAPQRFERDAAAKPYRGAGAGVLRESVGAPRRERGALKPAESGRQRAGGDPYSAWSGAGKGADSAAAPGARRTPASTTDRPRRAGPPGARGTRPPRPR